MIKNLSMLFLTLFGVAVYGADAITFSDDVNKLLKIVPRSERADYYIFNDLLPSDFFDKLKAQPKIQLYPVFADRASWENARNYSHAKHIADGILDEADKLLNTAPEELTQEDFNRFITEGNRSIFENKYFSRRKNLSYLVLACCLSGNKEKYIPQIITYTKAILAEDTWCVPAHCLWNGKEVNKYKQCDLFAGDTAAMLAIMINILGDELDKEIPGFAKEVNSEVIKHTFGNLLDANTHDLNYWYHAERPWNWISWCSSNCLLSALLAAPTPELRAEYVQMILYPLSRYYKACDDDGFSPEGASYFPASAGLLFQTLEYMEKAIPNSTVNFYKEQKIRKMLSFLTEIRIGNNMITYSDSSPKSKANHLLMTQIAKRLNSSELMDMVKNTPLTGDNSRRLLMRNLTVFFDYSVKPLKSSSKQVHSTLFRNRLAILRTNGFSGSLKAGHNNELHNHNDLGHFTIYYKDKPIIIDVGTGTYSAIDFSDKRFTLWYTRGNGHNAPLINGVEQENDENDVATLAEIKEENKVQSVICDLSKSYPEAAKLKKFERTLICAENFAEVHDNLQTDGETEVEISLFTMEKVQIQGNKVILGEVPLVLDNLVCAEANMESKKFGGWDKPIYRIILKGKSNKYSIKFLNNN